MRVETYNATYLYFLHVQKQCVIVQADILLDKL